MTIAFPIRFDIDRNHGLINDVPIRRRCVILDIEIAAVAAGQSVGNDFDLVGASFADVSTTVTDGSAYKKTFKDVL